MLKRFIPTDRFDSPLDIPVSYFADHGITALLMDIDNTLIPYEELLPNERVLAWLSAVKEAGIKVAFISNNHRKRVEAFNASLGYPAFWHGKKPFIGKLTKAMAALGAQKERTCLIGDQVFTDMLAGGRLGVYRILVLPIRDKRDPFTRLKRWLEKPILRRYDKSKQQEMTE